MVLALAAVAVVPAVAPASAANKPHVPRPFKVVDLGPLGEAGAAPVGIAVKGDVALTVTGSDGLAHAAVWTQGWGLRDLGPGRVVEINDKGQVAGERDGYAVRWESDGKATVLGGPNAVVSGINDDGTVVGRIGGHAVVWRGDRAGTILKVDVHQPAWGWSTAIDANDRGVVVGLWAEATSSPSNGDDRDAVGRLHVFRWDAVHGIRPWVVDSGQEPNLSADQGPKALLGITDSGWTAGNETNGAGVWVCDPKGRVRHLGDLGGLSADAVALAGAGSVALRWQDPDDDVDTAAVWSPTGGLVKLNTPTHWGYNGTATAVAGSGAVAGWTTSWSSGVDGAFLWDAKNGYRQLPGLVTPVNPGSGPVPWPTAISRRGWVTGTAQDAKGVVHAVVWRP